MSDQPANAIPHLKTTAIQALELFQERLAQVNAADPATYDAPHFLSIYRHPCPSANNVSKAIDLKEERLNATEDLKRSDLEPWALIWKFGSCKKCNQTARSAVGLLVDADKRPPISGRVSRS